MVDPVVVPILGLIGGTVSIFMPIVIASGITVHQIFKRTGLLDKIKAKLAGSRSRNRFKCQVMEIIGELPEEMLEHTDLFLTNLKEAMTAMKGVPMGDGDVSNDINERIDKAREYLYPNLHPSMAKVPSSPPME